MVDYKQRIQERAEEIALRDFRIGYHDLPRGDQHKCYCRAVDEQRDHVADLIDRARKMAEERL